MNSQEIPSLSLKDKDPKRDSASSLDARVRSLKIAKEDRLDNQRPSSRFPWMLAFALCILCGWLAYRDDEIMAKLGFARPVEESNSASVNAPNTLASNTTNSNSSNTAAPAGSQNASQPINSTPSVSPEKSTSPNPIALESRGYVIAKHQVLVSPQVSGRILTLNIEEGRRVVKGEILAEVERTEYQADYDQMRATLLRSKAELSELEAGSRPQEIAGALADLQEQEEVLSQLESEYKRMKDAVRSNSVSVAEFEQAQASYLSTKKRVEKLRQSHSLMKEGPRKERIEMARAAVIQAEANLDKSKWRLENCTLRAPITGTILKKNAEEGNLVNPVAFSGSTSVCDIADLSDLEIDLNIQERDVSKIYVNQQCEVRSEAFPKRVYKGTVSRLMPIADRAKGAVPVRVAVKVPEEEEGVYLKPEMSAIVVFFGTAPQ
ncbi:MAG: efflux RND transporter periplasmic adaptor subunit [Pirellulaceae bacterium]|nr:efflux RND transporter periplasmic adaptor subunit [Pirellulaceae bacterium]